MSIVVSTLQSYIDTDHELSRHCYKCGLTTTLDLPKLIEQFGPDYDVVDNREHFIRQQRCDRCGSPEVTITVAYRYAGKVSEMAREG